MPDPIPEPWLRGPLADVHPLVMPVFFSFAQVREELPRHTSGLAHDQVWRDSNGGASVGFHLNHIAGSIDRLSTYLAGGQLSVEQLQFLKEESSGRSNLGELLAEIEQSLEKAEERLRCLDPETLYERRSVGRRALPTTVIGLIVHIAEHTQRHLGQAITTAGVVRRS